jgi:hypothetical protein
LTPLAVSAYVLGPAIRLSTDNTALLFAVLSLIAVDTARDRLRSSERGWLWLLLWAAVAAAAAAWTRQVQAWLSGVIMAFAVLESMTLSRRTLVASLSAIPVLALVPLVMLWGSLTPPDFAGHQAGFN